jgi:hypothetical protein
LHDERVAWGVVALFAWDGAQLTEGWAEEDYLGRRRQLKSGTRDAVAAAGSWEVAASAGDPAAEAAARRWLTAAAACPLAGAETEIDVLFSAGSRVAYHGTWRTHVALPFAGIGEHVISDELGLQRALRA